MKTYRLILAIVSVMALGLALIACDPAGTSTTPTSSNTDGATRPSGSGNVDSVVAEEDGGK